MTGLQGAKVLKFLVSFQGSDNDSTGLKLKGITYEKYETNRVFHVYLTWSFGSVMNVEFFKIQFTENMGVSKNRATPKNGENHGNPY